MKNIMLALLALSLVGCSSWDEFGQGLALAMQGAGSAAGAYGRTYSQAQPVDYYQQYHQNYLNEDNNRLMRQQNQILQNNSVGYRPYCTVGVDC